ncbi:6-phosphogluconate phosphatase [Colletotrichum trifolii]|uniref:6-phosphogluconate phosphatase n=1 Tax=Colletotrichum trifolii TaxID=5466 RepID=A0A4R8QYE7_COLTR|nr:6-phosphogluconate phosphatase [Colletotrichum trifolii]
MGSQSGNKITTLLLDCDNTLVQSETLAFEACADLTNEILAAHDVDLQFTGRQLQHEFAGQSFQAMMRSLEARYDVSCAISDAQLDRYASTEDDRVISKLAQKKLQPCAGANAELARLAARGRHTTLAVVSSSALRRVRASLAAAGQASFFDPRHVFSAADSLLPSEPVSSKPDPAVYLHALDALAKTAGECVAVEDSPSGATAATRAGILTVGYVGACDEPEDAEALRVALEEAGCRLVMGHWAEFAGLLRRIEDGLD